MTLRPGGTNSHKSGCHLSYRVSVSASYPCEIHSQFELREQVENDAPLVIQDA